MNEMLPAFGFGFDFGSFEIDVAYYGKELGLEPGQMPTAALDLTIAIRPGAKERHWPWTQKSLVEVISGMGKKSNAQPVSASDETAVPEPAAEPVAPPSDETGEADETGAVSDDIEFIYEEKPDAGEAAPPDNVEAE
jgi:hypothetical protein